jgi:uncharacterized protein
MTCASPVNVEKKLLTFRPGMVETDGQFEGYASLWRVPDLSKDVVEPGAFRDSIARRGVSGVRLLWQHDPSEPIGRWLSLSEDVAGLRVRGSLNLAVARAREIRALMQEGAIDGLSIGFKTVKARADARTGLRHLMSVDLWEISLVTFPMLPQARVSAVKSAAPDASRLVGAIRRATRTFRPTL